MLKLAIDFGTAVTKIYRIGSGIVLSEATCLAIDKESGQIRAYGNEAKRLLGKTAEATEIVFPVYEGEIASERYAGALLEYFIGKAKEKKHAFGIEALFCVPCGCTEESREKYLRVARAAGISRANFVETPFLVALGQDIPLSDSNPVFAVDIGAGKTSVAVLSLDGIIAGFTMAVGGNNMDTHIIDCIAEAYDLKIGLQTSEKLKGTVGSPEADMQSMVINGRDIATGKPRSVAVTSEKIAEPIRIYIDKIVEYCELLLKMLPAEVSAAICKNGVFLAGGVCALAGFGDYISNKLQMEAHLASDVHYAVVLGGGRVIGNAGLYRRLAMD